MRGRTENGLEGGTFEGHNPRTGGHIVLKFWVQCFFITYYKRAVVFISDQQSTLTVYENALGKSAGKSDFTE